MLSTFSCRPSFWHKENRTPQAHHSRVHTCHPTLYNNNISEMSLMVQQVDLGPVQPSICLDITSFASRLSRTLCYTQRGVWLETVTD